MSIKMSTHGFGGVQAQLKAITKKFAWDGLLNVGYDAPYAMRVHEDLAAPRRSGQAKFLETPMRENAGLYRSMIWGLMKKGMSLKDAVRTVGEHLKAASQDLCPVLTGRLRASAFVRI